MTGNFVFYIYIYPIDLSETGRAFIKRVRLGGGKLRRVPPRRRPHHVILCGLDLVSWCFTPLPPRSDDALV